MLKGFATSLEDPSEYGDEKKLDELVASFNATFSSIYPVQLDANATLRLAQGVVAFEAEVVKAWAEPIAEFEKKVEAGEDASVGARMIDMREECILTC